MSFLPQTIIAYLAKLSHHNSNRICQDIPTQHLDFFLKCGTEEQG